MLTEKTHRPSTTDALTDTCAPTMDRRSLLASATFALASSVLRAADNKALQISPRLTPLSPTTFDGATIGRTTIDYPEGASVIVLHKDRRFCSHALSQFPTMRAFLDYDKSLSGSLKSDGEWTKPEHEIYFSSHTYALAKSSTGLGLSPRDWILGRKHEFTNWTNPMRTMLQAHFRHIRDLPTGAETIATLTHDPLIQGRDLVTFYNSTDHSFAISSIIEKRGSRNCCVTKFDEKPIVATSLLPLTIEFHGAFDRIHVYRFNHQGTKN